MTTVWRNDEIERFSKQFGIRAGIRLHEKAEDYHFPEGSFLAEGYAPPGGYVKDFGLHSRNRLFFGSLDWSSDPAVIKEINADSDLVEVLRQVGL